MNRIGNIEKKLPLLFEIKGNSLDDGPGIRTVVFFKGCLLNCIWCHNPESRTPDIEIAYDPKKCAGCNRCVDICPEKALSRKNRYFIDRKRCTLCFICAEECPSGALARVGFSMVVEAVVKKVLEDKPFFDNSGGGVTLSGGEPTLFMKYTAELAKELKQRGIRVLLETCGLFNYQHFHELLYPWLDIVYYDIKFYDADEHKRFCGVSNEIILENFVRLLSEARRNGVFLLPRTPLIPGITDTVANLKDIAGFLKNVGVKKAQLLPYNPLWHEKAWGIGCEDLLTANPQTAKFMARETLEHCKAIFRSKGITV